jgi:hypothetical protein
MGLDISAYRKLTKIDAVFDADGDPIDPVTRGAIEYDFYSYISHDFPGRADELEDKGVYRAEQCMGFRAGSYGGYNVWREHLATMAGYPGLERDRYNTGDIQIRHDAGAFQATKGPFWEVICFSDCEGVIGAKTCAKLAKDFAEWDARAKQYGDALDQPNWFYEKYKEWREAFEMGADDGAVDFH